jgi:RNA:NAD 2'-phosphotransferase (TPT1/KptA family)
MAEDYTFFLLPSPPFTVMNQQQIKGVMQRMNKSLKQNAGLSMTEKELVKTSKLLSLVLRQKPETIRLQLDENGWNNMQDLPAKMSLHEQTLSLKELQYVVVHNDKSGSFISRISANPGLI